MLSTCTIIDNMIHRQCPEHGRISHIIKHDRWYTFRTKQGQVDRQADKNRIGNKKAGNEYPLPVLADMQDCRRNPAHKVSQENRGKRQYQIRRYLYQ